MLTPMVVPSGRRMLVTSLALAVAAHARETQRAADDC
jgi:hypothetical protein